MGDGDSLLLVGVYINDLVICRPNNDDIVIFKQQIMERFKMGNLRLLTYYLGIKVK